MDDQDDIANQSLYDVSDATASQYWRELQKGLYSYPEFLPVCKPDKILEKIKRLSDGIEKKDKRIEDLQKRNESLTDLLADTLKQQKQQKPEPEANSEEISDLRRNYLLEFDQKNKIYGHWKTVTDERDNMKLKLEALQAERDELRRKLETREVETDAPTNNIMTVEVRGDKDVILKRDANGKCGVKFGCLRKQPLLLESNTVITGIKPGIPSFSEIGIGDFVIEVGGVNVQQLPYDDVLEHVKMAGDLKLKLRPKRNEQQKILKRHVTGAKSISKGLTLGIFVKTLVDPSIKDFNEMDEIIQVNSKSVYDLSLKTIYSCLDKNMKFEINHQRNPYDQFVRTSLRTSRLSLQSSHSGFSESSAFSTPRPASIAEIPRTPPADTYRPPLVVPDDASVSSHSSSHRGSLCEESSLKNGASLSSSQRQLNNASLTDLSEQFSGGSDPSGNSGEGEFDIDSGIVVLTVSKHEFEAFGWSFIGGSKVGIFLKAVDHWSPVENAGINVGWKILNVDGVSLEGVAFCFAMDFLSSLRNKKSVTVKLEKTNRETYQQFVTKSPFDYFHVRTLMDYKKKSSKESSFKMGETFCVIDSHYVDGSTNLKWKATNIHTKLTVFIPSQRTRFILTEDESNSKKKGNKTTYARYYEILDNVDIKSSIEEEEGAF